MAENGHAAMHREQAIAANNSVWELLDTDAPAVSELLSRAYSASYHWARAQDRTPANAARASWLLSRCHAVLGHGDLALHHADECAAVVAAAGLDDFDLAYSHEARARALAALGRLDEASNELAAARGTTIVEEQDGDVFESDLIAPPWFGLM